MVALCGSFLVAPNLGSPLWRNFSKLFGEQRVFAVVDRHHDQAWTFLEGYRLEYRSVPPIA